jgi:hypothetical protein
MESINTGNYEIWFADYLDGQLDESQLDLLLDFLEAHPELKAELAGISGVGLDASEVAFPGKEILMKGPDDIPGIPTDDQLCIARMESDLSKKEQDAFDERISRDSKLMSLYRTYLGTRLKPEPIVFGHKSELYHKNRVLAPWIITVVSSAAIIILGLILWPRAEKQGTELLTATPGLTDSLKTPAPQVEIPVVKPGAASMDLIAAIPETIETGKAETPQNNPARDFIPMNSVGHRSLEMFPVSIPDPGNNPVIFASVYQRSMETAIPDDTYLTLPQLALQIFREKVLGQERSFVKTTRFSLWEVAGAGVSKINQLAGTDMQLDRAYGSDGQVMAVSFNSRLIDFETPVRPLQEKEQ